MRYTWSTEAKHIIEALEKRGFFQIGHDLNQYDFGTMYFSNTDKIEELNSKNLIIIKRKPTHTMVEFPEEFDKNEIKAIHEEAFEVTESLGFAPQWAVLLWNKKTNEYKFLCLQPMFVMGILMQLGVFDYSHAIDKLKFNKKDSNEVKYQKFFEYLKQQKFKTESQTSAEFNIVDSKGSIKYQVEQHFGKDWEYVGPEKQFAKVEQEFYDKYMYMDALLEKAKEVFGYDVSDEEKKQIDNFNFLNCRRLFKEFQKYFKQQKTKDKDKNYFDCLKEFEIEIGFEIPLFVLNSWEEWEKLDKGDK